MASESPLAASEEQQETIGEYSHSFVPLSGDDLGYLDSDCFRRSDGKSVIDVLPPFRDTGLCRVGNTSFAGIIQLDGIRLMFSTKVKANLFHMLSYTSTLERSKSIFLTLIDPSIYSMVFPFPTSWGGFFCANWMQYSRGAFSRNISVRRKTSPS